MLDDLVSQDNQRRTSPRIVLMNPGIAQAISRTSVRAPQIQRSRTGPASPKTGLEHSPINRAIDRRQTVRP
jgi:hypothetical protein